MVDQAATLVVAQRNAGAAATGRDCTVIQHEMDVSTCAGDGRIGKDGCVDGLDSLRKVQANVQIKRACKQRERRHLGTSCNSMRQKLGYDPGMIYDANIRASSITHVE